MKTKKLTGRKSPLESLFLSLYFFSVGIFIYFIIFCQWFKKTIILIPKAVNDLFSEDLEKIEGEVVEIGERYDTVWLFCDLSNGLTMDQMQIVPQKIDPIHIYFLKIKNKLKVITIKVPFYFYKEIKEQISEGTTNFSLLCTKDFFVKNEYNLHF